MENDTHVGQQDQLENTRAILFVRYFCHSGTRKMKEHVIPFSIGVYIIANINNIEKYAITKDTIDFSPVMCRGSC